jgi:hypothetical protein
MNAVLTNLLLKLATAALGALVARGYITNSGEQEMLGLAGLGIAWLVSHIHIKALDAGSGPGPTRPGSAPLFVLMALFALPEIFTGCSSTPARQAYNIVSAASMTSDQAWAAWTNYVAVANPPVATQASVIAAFQKAQAAELVAIDAARAYAELAATGNTNSIAVNLQTTVIAEAARSNALADLLNLLRSLNINI